MAVQPPKDNKHSCRDECNNPAQFVGCPKGQARMQIGKMCVCKPCASKKMNK